MDMTPGYWSGVLAPLNTESGDGRVLVLAEGKAPEVRPLPLPLCAQRQIGDGHNGGEVVGRITEVWVENGMLMGAGDFDLADPVAQEWARKIADGFAGWVSVDLDAMHMTSTPRDVQGNTLDVDAVMAELESNPDLPVPEVGDPLLRAESWRLMGATLVSGPAFAEAKIVVSNTPVSRMAVEDDEDKEGGPAEPTEEPEEEAPGDGTPTDENEDGQDDEEDDEERAAVSTATFDANDGPHTGGMVALVPAPEDANRLAVAAGLPVEELHLTLAYLGDDLTGMGEEQVAAIVEAATSVGATTVDGEVFGTATFNPGADNACAVYLVEADGLHQLQQDMTAALAPVVDLPGTHDGFIPHITAGYGIDAATLEAVGSIRFDRLRIAVAGTNHDVPLEQVTANLTAAAIVYQADHFVDPQLDGPSSLRVDEDGRVYGHLATWGTCHIGFADRCVTPPASPQLYRYFHRGVVDTTEGSLPVGLLTMDTGHAGLSNNRVQAMSHYDDTGTQVAVVRAGEDQHGIWVAGHLLPGVTSEQADKLRRSSLSGDWRGVNGQRELVAALVVNVPGFPIPRTETLTASGADTVVAAGVVLPMGRDRKADTAERPETADFLALVASATRDAPRKWKERQALIADVAAQSEQRQRERRLAAVHATMRSARAERAMRRVALALEGIGA